MCDYEDGVYSDKIAYSGVNDMCILAHGDYDIIDFNPDDPYYGYIKLGSVDDLVNIQACNIRTLDIVACSCGRENSEGKCIAKEFASSVKIGEVFAWDGSVHYDFGYNTCFASQSKGYCRFYRDANGSVKTEVIGRVIKSGTRRFEL